MPYERVDYLLHEIVKDCKEYKLNQEKEYNIFKVLKIENKEVLICRVLADLLSPKGFHRKGVYYLESFLKEILQIQNIPYLMIEELILS